MMSNCILIQKEKWDEIAISFAKEQRITEPENVEYIFLYENFAGIIFYIPEEKIYGLEMIWEDDKPMFLRWGAYSKELNQLLTEAQKNLKEYQSGYLI